MDRIKGIMAALSGKKKGLNDDHEGNGKGSILDAPNPSDGPDDVMNEASNDDQSGDSNNMDEGIQLDVGAPEEGEADNEMEHEATEDDMGELSEVPEDQANEAAIGSELHPDIARNTSLLHKAAPSSLGGDHAGKHLFGKKPHGVNILIALSRAKKGRR
jgi:hypothetical protein